MNKLIICVCLMLLGCGKQPAPVNDALQQPIEPSGCTREIATPLQQEVWVALQQKACGRNVQEGAYDGLQPIIKRIEALEAAQKGNKAAHAASTREAK